MKKAKNFSISILLFLTVVCSLADKPTPTLLISLDGFRSLSLELFLKENPNSNIKKYFVDEGVKADYMQPSFPTLTFPNHYTLVTGLYMESHGIVGNYFYEPNDDKVINLFNSSDNILDPKYWNKADPIWLSAKNQGLKAASFFWTGSEVWTRHPDFFLNYNKLYAFTQRCDEVFNWFKKFDMDFVTLYFDEPDKSGHKYGPKSNEYKQAIKTVDDTIGYLMKLFSDAKLDKKLNIIVVSDHGMADMYQTIYFYDHVEKNLIDANKTILGIVSNIYPINNEAKIKVYESLSKVANMRVFYRENLPENFHYKNSDRVGPIVAIANEGYVISDVEKTILGNHGFDNNIESMRAIFLARGPDFKVNKSINAIKNVDVYPLLCKILKIICRPNNGTIHATIPALFNSSEKKFYQNYLILCFFLFISYYY